MSSQIVWAKFGCSSWPARICSPPEILQGKKHTENSNAVIFFRTHNYAWVQPHNIHDYVQHKHKFVSKNKSKIFKEAIEEADQEISKQQIALMQIENTVNDNETKVGDTSSKNKITIKTMETRSLLATFKENERYLRSIFNARRGQLDRFNNGMDYDFLTVLYRIATSQQQKEMFSYMCEAIVGKNYYQNPKYENLLWSILLPEWLIAICTKQFSLSKEEILSQIKKDEEDSLIANDSFNLSEI